ncbi:MAG: gliding motility-associated C-terminal domain-containing protein, partial [Bacteroidetes bacterium]|nr:gliding motility-associated C-terminal domain-containing protein [Bacteroidota bacterium]
GSYTISLTVTSSLGSCTSSITNTNMINVYPNPVANFTAPSNTSIINPVITYSDNSAYAASWHWNFGDPFAGADSISSLQNPSHTFSQAGTYCATLAVISPYGCVDTTMHCIVIEPEFTFFIPNAFSPNGDGINDDFFGKGDYIKKFEMSVYDRWGNLIFFADDINKHWDGKANHGSELAQEDVYVWKISITDANDKKHSYIGTVTIVK